MRATPEGGTKRRDQKKVVPSLSPTRLRKRVSVLTVYLTALLIIFVAFAHSGMGDFLKSKFAPAFGALVLFAAILGVQEWSDMIKSWIKAVTSFVNLSWLRIGIFCGVCTLPLAVVSSGIGFCLIDRVQQEQRIQKVAEVLYRGQLNNESVKLIKEAFVRYPRRKELPLLLGAKAAYLRAAQDQDGDAFREFDRRILTAIVGDISNREDQKALVTNLHGFQLRELCTCESAFTSYDIIPLLARFAAEGIPDRLDISLALLTAGPNTATRQVYLHTVATALAIEAVRSTTPVGESLPLLMVNAQNLAIRIDDISLSPALSFQEEYQQGLDMLAQANLEICGAKLAANSTEASAARERAVSLFVRIGDIRRATIAAQDDDSVSWTQPPDKLMLFWHVNDWRGLLATVPPRYSFVPKVLERYKKICPDYNERLKAAFQARHPSLVDDDFSAEWRKGTILQGSLDPGSSEFVAAFSLRQGWRY